VPQSAHLQVGFRYRIVRRMGPREQQQVIKETQGSREFSRNDAAWANEFNLSSFRQSLSS